MYECGYMYFRFDRRHLEFLSDIDVLPLKKTSLSSPNKKPDIQRYFIQPYHVYQGCLLCAYILLILDEFHLSKLLI